MHFGSILDAWQSCRLTHSHVARAKKLAWQVRPLVIRCCLWTCTLVQLGWQGCSSGRAGLACCAVAAAVVAVARLVAVPSKQQVKRHKGQMTGMTAAPAATGGATTPLRLMLLMTTSDCQRSLEHQGRTNGTGSVSCCAPHSAVSVREAASHMHVQQSRRVCVHVCVCLCICVCVCASVRARARYFRSLGINVHQLALALWLTLCCCCCCSNCCRHSGCHHKMRSTPHHHSQLHHIAPQVDVRALKGLLWDSLIAAADPAGAAEPASCVPFQRVIDTVPANSAAGARADVSVHMCFICLLHLANEQGLAVRGSETLDTLSVSGVPV